MIRVTHLTVDYGKQPVVNRLSFFAGPENSPVVLAGRNGSGKSSLLKAILGQIPYTGEIRFEPEGERIAWLPQNYQVTFRVPVTEFVGMGTVQPKGLFPVFPSDARQLALKALEALGISHLGDKSIDELSGGEWQLVCLAQMEAQNAPVWLLDEPTSSLDIHFKSRVFEFLWNRAKFGTTILISTHDLPFLPLDGGSILFLHGEYRQVANSAEKQQEIISVLRRGS